MEIDADVVKVFHTYLQEVWPYAEVTDEMVREQIELILIISVFNETQKYDLPKSLGALYAYYGVEMDDPIMEEDNAQEEREDEIEVENSACPEKDA